MINGIHHFSIIASFETGVEFYARLGFRESKQIKRDYDMVVLKDGFGIGLELFIDHRHSRLTGEPLGFRTICLKVDSLTEFDGAVMADWNGERYVKIADPDGNMLQLHE